MLTKRHTVLSLIICGSFFAIVGLAVAPGPGLTAAVLNTLGILGSVSVVFGVPVLLMTEHLEMSDRLSLRRRIHSSKKAAWSSFQMVFIAAIGTLLMAAITAYITRALIMAASE